jgi:hypothetical protein
MNPEDTLFPAYRRYKNGRNYFKILNPAAFEEIRLVGKLTLVSLTEAKLFPEQNFVRDLLYGYTDFAEEISREDYEKVRSRAGV